MTVISRTHKLRKNGSTWQWAVSKSEDRLVGTVAYLDDKNQWVRVDNIEFETEAEFHQHVDTFLNGFYSAK